MQGEPVALSRKFQSPPRLVQNNWRVDWDVCEVRVSVASDPRPGWFAAKIHIPSGPRDLQGDEVRSPEGRFAARAIRRQDSVKISTATSTNPRSASSASPSERLFGPGRCIGCSHIEQEQSVRNTARAAFVRQGGSSRFTSMPQTDTQSAP